MRRFARLLLAVSFLAVTFGCGSPATTVHTAAPLPRFDPVGKAIADAETKFAVQQYLQLVEQQQKAAAEAQQVAQARAQARKVRATSASKPIPLRTASVATVQSLGPCGGDLPPCFVKQRESKGDYRIWNGGCYAPTGWAGSRSPCGGSTASGAWQILRSTWGHVCWSDTLGHRAEPGDPAAPDATCYLNAADAPPHVQDARARELWANGAGHTHWGV